MILVATAPAPPLKEFSFKRGRSLALHSCTLPKSAMLHAAAHLSSIRAEPTHSRVIRSMQRKNFLIFPFEIELLNRPLLPPVPRFSEICQIQKSSLWCLVQKFMHWMREGQSLLPPAHLLLHL